VIVATAALTAAGVAGALAWAGRGGREASIAEAVRRLRSGGATGGRGFLRPAVGVYEMRGTGTERLSLLDTTQRWGPRVPMTVRHRPDGCWRLRVSYNTNHWQEWDHCVRRAGLLEVAGRTFQRFDFVAATVSDRTEFRCRPPVVTIRVAADPSASWPARCEGHSPARGTRTVSAGRNRFLGLTRVRVGHDAIPAYRYRQVRTITGDQEGRERTEVWFSARDALPLRLERDLRVRSPSPLGTVVYTERGVLALRHPQPTR